MPDGLEHPPHLPVPTLVQHELEAGRAQSSGLRGGGRAVVELDAVREAAKHVVRGLALDVRHVRLLDAVARMGEPVRKRSVVRQEEDARRVAVEPPHGDDPHLAADEVDHGRPALRVARRRDRAARLVQQNVPKPLGADRAAVDADVVGAADEGIQLAGCAVHRHPPRLDQLVGASPRGDTGPREVGVQSHRAPFSRVRSGP